MTITGELVVSSVQVRARAVPFLMVTPPVHNFPDAINQQHEWGADGWYLLDDLRCAAINRMKLGGCPFPANKINLDLATFRNRWIFPPTQRKLFATVSAEKRIDETVLSYETYGDSYHCPFANTERNQYFVLTRWGMRVLHLAQRGVVLLDEDNSGPFGVKWDGNKVYLSERN